MNALAGYISAITLAILVGSTGCSNCTDGICPPPDIPPQQPNVVSLDLQNWYIFYSDGMPAHPFPNGDGAWSFPFPIAGHVNYIQTPFQVTALPHKLRMTFRVASDAPGYKVMDPADISPATVHIFFEQRNDNLVNPNGWWWADPSVYDLGSRDNETITTVVPFDAAQWSNVDDGSDPESFYAALRNVGWIGVTCGGQYFWGHGVALTSGAAGYILVDLQVE